MRVGVIGRFRPLHKGAEVMLKTLCELADEVVIGVGSANKYNMRNPFTPEEVETMIDIVLEHHENYEVLLIPDFAHKAEHRNGARWREEVLKQYGRLDLFVTGNEYVRKLLIDDYEIVSPGDLIPKESWVVAKGTMVRYRMARHENWQVFLPKRVADYVEDNGLDERFRKEFGLETIGTLWEKDGLLEETVEEEYLYTTEA